MNTSTATRSSDPLAKSRTWFILGSMALAVGVLVLDAWKFQGWKSAAVWGYGFSLLYAAWAFLKKDNLMFRFMLFALTAGLVELMADYWLVVHTKTLFYPPDEPMLAASPAYMPFSWMVVLIQIGYIGFLINKKKSLLITSIIVGILGCCIIPLYEFLAIHAGWWHYENTKMLGPVPVYIFVAEGLLMLTIPDLFDRTEKASYGQITLFGIIQGLVMWLACVVAWNLTGK